MEASLRAEQEEFAVFRVNIDESMARRAHNDTPKACEDATRQSRTLKDPAEASALKGP